MQLIEPPMEDQLPLVFLEVIHRQFQYVMHLQLHFSDRHDQTHLVSLHHWPAMPMSILHLIHLGQGGNGFDSI